ncbi:MAG: hypothetical protein KDA52_15835 [Planctomycetaceae bacterium]|nr:hypothetical protein [Planctomycetaceae bacterium]
MRGLKHLNSKKSRMLLWEARTWEFDSPESTEQFRSDLEAVQKEGW